MTLAEISTDFLPDDNAAHGWRNHRVTRNVRKFCGEIRTNLGRDFGILENQRALKILPAVQAGTQNEMAVQQRAGFFEYF
jgi:hypothetical protein